MPKKLILRSIGAAAFFFCGSFILSPVIAQKAAPANSTIQPASMPASRPATMPAAKLILTPKLPSPPTKSELVFQPLKLKSMVGWGEGESMTFSLKIAGVEAGRAALTVGQVKAKDGRQTLMLRGFSETSPFVTAFFQRKEDMVTTVDSQTMYPLSSTNKRLSPGKNRTVKTTFGQKIIFAVQTEKEKFTRHIALPALHYDFLSAIYTLRSVDLQPKTHYRLQLVDGLSLLQAEITVEDKERIYTANGPRDTIRASGFLQIINELGKPIAGKRSRRVTAWISADDKRLPLKVQAETNFGAAEARLTSYNPPRRRLTFPLQSASRN